MRAAPNSCDISWPLLRSEPALRKVIGGLYYRRESGLLRSYIATHDMVVHGLYDLITVREHGY